MAGRLLIAGIGNIFLGDDGFGVEVVRRLRGQPLGPDVDVVDFGIRGVHLAYELAGGAYGTAILVDAAARGGPPGTLYAIDAADQADGASEGPVDAHGLTPDAVLAWVRRIGGADVAVTIVGCEPSSVAEGIGLSAPVDGAVDEAIRMIREMAAGRRQDPSCA